MELALQCTNESPEERINMVEILARLKNIKGEFLTERERRRPSDKSTFSTSQLNFPVFLCAG
jgi:interleukin-1 receptor-associated kinase 1